MRKYDTLIIIKIGRLSQYKYVLLASEPLHARSLVLIYYLSISKVLFFSVIDGPKVMIEYFMMASQRSVGISDVVFCYNAIGHLCLHLHTYMRRLIVCEIVRDPVIDSRENWR